MRHGEDERAVAREKGVCNGDSDVSIGTGLVRHCTYCCCCCNCSLCICVSNALVVSLLNEWWMGEPGIEDGDVAGIGGDGFGDITGVLCGDRPGL